MSEIVLEDVSQFESDFTSEPLTGNVRRLLDTVEVEVEVIVGTAAMKLGELLNGGGSKVICLRESLGEPAILRCDGLVIGRGILVAEGDKLAVKVVESK